MIDGAAKAYRSSARRRRFLGDSAIVEVEWCVRRGNRRVCEWWPARDEDEPPDLAEIAIAEKRLQASLSRCGE
jgi:hypothetical protein